MLLNYVLLGVTGLLSLGNLVSLVKGRGWLGERCFSGLLAIAVFVLVLTATLLGVDYQTFRGLLEAGLQ